MTVTAAIARLRRMREAAPPRSWNAVISTGCVRYLGPPRGTLEHGDYVAGRIRALLPGAAKEG